MSVDDGDYDDEDNDSDDCNNDLMMIMISYI